MAAPRAVLYPRVSSRDQEVDGTSLDTQEAAARRYCAERGYEVVDVFREVAWSEALDERPVLTHLRERVRAGGIDVVVGHAVDRISRQSVHLAVLLYEWENAGARLELVTESFEDSAVGRFLRNAKAFVAEVEAEKIRERTQRGKLARVAAGKLPAMARPPYGYLWADPEKATLVADPVTSPIVQRVYREVAAGVPLRALAAQLDAEQIPTPAGATHWRGQALAFLLRQPFYVGAAYAWRQESRKERGKRIVTKRPPEAWTRLPEGTAPALVTEREAAACRAQLQQNRSLALRSTPDPARYLLRGGLARCASCGGALHGGGVGMKRPDGTVYRYYRCGSRGDGRGRLRSPVCTEPASAAVPELDAAAWRAVLTVAQRGRPRPAAAPTRPETVQRAALERDHRQTKRALERAAARDLAAETEEEAEPYRREVKRHAGRLRDLADQLAALDAARETADQAAQVSGAWSAALAARWRLLGLRLPADYEEMRGWVLKLGLRVLVRPRGEKGKGPRWRFEWGR
jgi:site-specific DNA recombinase